MLAGNLGGQVPGASGQQQQGGPNLGGMANAAFAAGTPSPNPANSSLAAMLARFGGPGAQPGAFPGMAAGPTAGGPPGSTAGGQGAPPPPHVAGPAPPPQVPPNPAMAALTQNSGFSNPFAQSNLWRQLLARMQMQQGSPGSWMA
jgi:hypothetical protein